MLSHTKRTLGTLHSNVPSIVKQCKPNKAAKHYGSNTDHTNNTVTHCHVGDQQERAEPHAIHEEGPTRSHTVQKRKQHHPCAAERAVSVFSPESR
ncbi:hypothetical protein NDU88_001551 [Pleurodeles waltl]|uniref:Uncharacterized protein n=1 Tax=Pleurodeles waltl TaxID=8319 RepID=A0AAV7LCX9_PLEWA|nr:hypothetical protein NDU88_001551 [Pleurodeles waltl]